MYKFGDILLLNFPFTGLTGSKKRPALFIFDADNGDILVARITTRMCFTQSDVSLTDWSAAGLSNPSYVRLKKLAALDNKLVNFQIGTLSTTDLAIVEQELLNIFTHL